MNPSMGGHTGADHPAQQAKPDRALQSTDRATHNVSLGGDQADLMCKERRSMVECDLTSAFPFDWQLEVRPG
jgi:hypothetical protein